MHGASHVLTLGFSEEVPKEGAREALEEPCEEPTVISASSLTCAVLLPSHELSLLEQSIKDKYPACGRQIDFSTLAGLMDWWWLLRLCQERL